MRSSRTLFGLIAALALAGATTASAASPRAGVTEFRRTTAPPVAPARRTPSVAQGTSPWLELGPNDQPGGFHCVSSDILNVPVVGCGSDGVGYWWGYALGDAGQEERGPELGHGIVQMTNRLHFPPEGGYYQPINTICTDGQMRHTNDDGANWAESVLNVPPGYSPSIARQLGYDSGSINVAYALLYGSDDLGNDGALFLRSFDGGQTFDFTHFVPTRRAHMWCSREGAGLILLAYEDGGGNVVVESNDQLGDGSQWNVLGTVPSPFGAPDQDSIYVVAQESSTIGSLHAWLITEGTMLRTVDGGANWETVREVASNTDRCIGTSLQTPDLILWTTPDPGVYWSPDGGTTAHPVPVDPFPGGGTVHNAAGNVDCFRWNLAASSGTFTVTQPGADGRTVSMVRALPNAVRVRPDAARGGVAAGGDERFYLSTEGGVYAWSFADTTAYRFTNGSVRTLQVSDVLPLRDAQVRYSTVLATRSMGVLGIREWGPSIPQDISWNFAITSYPLHIGHVVSSAKPTSDDPVMFADFRWGGITTFGNGVFTGYGANFAGIEHGSLVADPVGPYRFWVASDALHRVTWNRGADTWSDDVIPSPLDGSGVRGTGFAIAPSNTSRWYLAGEDGRVWFSANAGASWTLGVAAGDGPLPNDPAYYSVTITVNPANPLEAWAVGTRVIRTTDGGAHWTTMQAGLPAPARAWDIAFDGTPAANVYIAADSGPFRWNTGVGAWEDLAPAGGVVPAVPFRAVAPVTWEGTMRWGTWGRGVWDYATGSTVGAPAPARPSLALAASRNPVRDLARLDWTLAQPGHAKLELLDVAGRRVQTLHDGLETAGGHSSTLDVRGLGAGVYFARLTAGADMRTARVVVVR